MFLSIQEHSLDIKKDDGTYQSMIRLDQKGFHLIGLTTYPLAMEICTEKKDGKWECEMSR